MNRWDIINRLIEQNNYKKYLEIGYYKGWSFDEVNCETKVAVDPNPCKTPDQETLKEGWILNFRAGFPNFDRTHQLWKVSSDKFFEMLKEENLFDIIFIDGKHEASQVSRDIRNSLNHLSEGGTIVLHDCNPPFEAHTTTGIDGNWTGDAYKAWCKWRSYHPEYETYTVDTDWGCGVIHNNPDHFSMYIEGLYKGSAIENYVDVWALFNAYRSDLLNLISVEEFLNKTNERVNHSDSSAK